MINIDFEDYTQFESGFDIFDELHGGTVQHEICLLKYRNEKIKEDFAGQLDEHTTAEAIPVLMVNLASTVLEYESAKASRVAKKYCNLDIPTERFQESYYNAVDPEYEESIREIYDCEEFYAPRFWQYYATDHVKKKEERVEKACEMDIDDLVSSIEDFCLQNRKYCSDLRALVIIDSLESIKNTFGFPDDAYQEMCMSILSLLSRKTGACIVVCSSSENEDLYCCSDVVIEMSESEENMLKLTSFRGRDLYQPICSVDAIEKNGIFHKVC